jgi:hypothetical protein
MARRQDEAAAAEEHIVRCCDYSARTALDTLLRVPCDERVWLLLGRRDFPRTARGSTI